MSDIIDTFPDWKLDTLSLQRRNKRREQGEHLPKPTKLEEQLEQERAAHAATLKRKEELSVEIAELSRRQEFTASEVGEALGIDELRHDLAATQEQLAQAKAAILPGTFVRCMSGHYYARTRGDEECPICDKLTATWEQLVHAQGVAQAAVKLAGELQDLALELTRALEALKEDYSDAEGCYCGQIVGGVGEDGDTLGKCGDCLAKVALRHSTEVLGAHNYV